MSTYRYSALAYAAVRMWRGWTVVVPVVVFGAVVQAVLVGVADGASESDGVREWVGVVAAAASVLLAAVAFVVVAAVALSVADGRVRWPAVLARLRAHGRNWIVWALAWAVVVGAAYVWWWVAAAAVAAVTPYLMLASLDGRGNALAANGRVIVRRPRSVPSRARGRDRAGASDRHRACASCAS